MSRPQVITHQGVEPLVADVLQSLLSLADQAILRRGLVRVSLSGGTTPRRLYEALARSDLDWRGAQWFWGDERNVPHDHAESNYRMVAEAMLRPAGVPPETVFPVPVDPASPAAAASRYEALLRERFAADSDAAGDAPAALSEDGFPRWDLVLLGLGDDVHTASLFPQSPALDVRDRWFVENWVEKFSAYRYTLTAPAINSARETWFLVTGQGKREALAKLLSDAPQDPRLCPARLILPTRIYATVDALPG